MKAAQRIRTGLLLLAFGSLGTQAIADQPDAIVVQAGGQALTGQNLDELQTLYAWVLERPLSAPEKTALTGILIDEFKTDPPKIAKNYVAIHQQLPMILSATPVQQARRRAEIWKALIKDAPSNPAPAAILKLFAGSPSVLRVTEKGVVTQPQIDALIGCDDDVAQVAGFQKTSAAERARITSEIVATFPSFSPNEDHFEAIEDAEERCLALGAFVDSKPENRAAVTADIKAKVHDPKDAPLEARALENNALLLARMQQFALQQKIIAGVVATYQAEIAAIREAGDRFMWHESRAYQHGEAKPGAHTGLGPD